MAGGIVRVGDIMGPGGVIQGPGATSVLINGRPAASVGAQYSSHPCCGRKGCPPTHCGGAMSDTTKSVLVGGVPVLTATGVGLCSDTMRTFSKDVLVGA